MNVTNTSHKIKLKPLALPVEHGGWGFLLEPVALGLLTAPSWPGVLIGVAAVAGFLARHPFKIAFSDWRRGKRYPRTPLAERFMVLYAAIALLAITAAGMSAGFYALRPLVPALPFALIYLAYDAQKQSREWIAQMSGPLALSATASAIALAGGWPEGKALALWAVLLARALPSIVYVRARLRLEREGNFSALPALLAHLAGLAAAVALIRLELLPWLAVPALMALLLRAVVGLSPLRRPAPAKKIGILELVYGAVTVLLVALGYWIDL